MGNTDAVPRSDSKMEDGVAVGVLPSDNCTGAADDRFMFIGCGGKRKALIERLRKLVPDLEIFAPVERRMVRPRRKSKRVAHFIEVPLFFEYIAINLDQLGGWHMLLDMREVWFVLMDTDTMSPKTAPREALRGFLTGAKTVSWDGATVEFVRGPMIGRQGTFKNGRVVLGSLGAVRANVFDLVKV